MIRCEGCPLTNCQTVPGFGPDKADIVIVGEAPGSTEVKQGRPFVGQAGQLLDGLIKEVGLDKYDIYYTNTVLCRPWPHRAPNTEEIKACKDRLRAEILARNPKIIVGTGNIPLRALLGKNGITKYRGRAGDFEGIPVVATYHPAAVLRGRQEWYHTIKQDLMMVRDLLADNRPVIDFDWNIDNTEILFHENKLVGFDVETDSQGRLLCLGLGVLDGPSGKPYVTVFSREAFFDLKPEIYWFLQANRLLAHNGKFDLQVLRREGIFVDHHEDTMLLHYALENRQGRNSLKDMAATYLYVGDYDAEIAPYISCLEKVPFSEVAWYNAQDVAYTLMLYDLLSKRFLDPENQGVFKVYRDLLIPGSNVLTGMEYRGVRIDTEALDRLDKEYTNKLDELKFKMTTHAGREFNPNSPKQLQQVMYYELKFPVIGKVSTDRAALLELKKHEDHPFLDCLLQYRQISKLHSTYVKGIRERLDDKDLLHASFNLHTTVTGRLSSSNPNLQNIPARGTKDIRNLFVANEGWRFLEVDFSQAEIRCLAWYSDDENLLQILREGGDLHRKTAALVFNKPEEEVTDLERHIGKTLNFAVLYGAGPGTVMDTVLETVPDAKFTYDQAKRAINDWFRAFPGAAEWIRGVQENVLITKEVSTPLGRRRRFDLLTPDTTPEVQRQAVNTPIQSLASDLCLLSLINLSHKSTRAFPLITVHDSILLEFPEQADPLEVAEEVEDIIQGVVKEVLGDKVPFVVDFAVGSRWGDLEELEVVHVGQ